jgi:O-antigen ligase
MYINIKSESINQSFILLIIILGLLTGIALVIAGTEGKKWLIAVTLAMILFYSLFVSTKNFRQLFLWLAVFAIPIRLDFHLIIKATPYSQLKGLPISLFDMVFTLLFFYWILQLLLRRQKFRFFATISIPALAYILLAGISTHLTQDKILSYCMLFLIFKGYLVFLYLANNIQNKNELILIISGLAVGILIQGILGSLQYVTGGTLGLKIFGEAERAFRTTVMAHGIISRVGGTVGDANLLAMYLNFFLPLLFCFLFTDAHFKYRVLIGFVFILGLFVEVLSFSRGGWLALGFGLFVSFYGLLKARFGSRLKSLLVTGVTIFLAVILILGLFTDVRDRLFKDDYGAAYGRIHLMDVAFNIIRSNPLKGVGLNNYATVMNRYDRTREDISYRFLFPVHNAFLLIASESGLLALLCFLLILAGVLKKGILFFKPTDQFLSIIGIGSFCGIITWIIHAQFRMDFAGMNGMLWFSMGLLVAINQLVLSRRKSSNPDISQARTGYLGYHS